MLQHHQRQHRTLRRRWPVPGVSPAGGKWWRWKYRAGGKEKRLSFGTYSDVGLKAARGKREAARQQLASGIDPGEARKAGKIAEAGAESFEAIAREWHAKFASGWTPTHSQRILGRFEKDVFPWLGKRPIAELRAPDLLAVLRRIETRGTQDTAHRVKQNCGQVFRYALATGRAERDPTGDLRGALAIYYSDNFGLYPSDDGPPEKRLSTSIVPKYLKTMPSVDLPHLYSEPLNTVQDRFDNRGDWVYSTLNGFVAVNSWKPDASGRPISSW